jgi:hypothetical protein
MGEQTFEKIDNAQQIKLSTQLLDRAVSPSCVQNIYGARSVSIKNA